MSIQWAVRSRKVYSLFERAQRLLEIAPYLSSLYAFLFLLCCCGEAPAQTEQYPTEQYPVQGILEDIGIKHGMFFTVEYVSTSTREVFLPTGNTDSISDNAASLQSLRSIFTDYDCFQDKNNPAIYHLIEKSLPTNNSALAQVLTDFDFQGNAQELIAKLQLTVPSLALSMVESSNSTGTLYDKDMAVDLPQGTVREILSAAMLNPHRKPKARVIWYGVTDLSTMRVSIRVY